MCEEVCESVFNATNDNLYENIPPSSLRLSLGHVSGQVSCEFKNHNFISVCSKMMSVRECV